MKNIFLKHIKKVYLFFIGVILFLAFFLRVNDCFFQRDFWYDEAFTGVLVRSSWLKMNLMIFLDVHPPLYYWLVKFWSMLFGYSALAIRSFSLLFGILTVVAVIFVANEFFGRLASIFSGFITAISPFAIQYSGEARMYSLFGFIFVFAAYFFYKALKGNQKNSWIITGIFCGLSFYTHYLFLFFLIIFFLVFALLKLGKYKKWFWIKNLSLESFERSGNLWYGMIVFFLFFLSWFPFFIIHLVISYFKGGLIWVPTVNLSELPKTIGIFLFGHPPGSFGVPVVNEFYFGDVPYLFLFLIVIFFSLGLLFWVYFSQNKKFEIIYLSLMSIGVLLLLIFLSKIGIRFYVARYFMPSAILIYILFGGLLSFIYEKTKFACVILSLYVLSLFLLKPIDFNSGWYELYKNKNNETSDKIIIADNPFDYSTARFYFGERRVRLYNKEDPQKSFLGWTIIGDQNRLNNNRYLEENKGDIMIVSKNCEDENWKKQNLIMKKIDKKDQLEICFIVDSEMN